MDDIIIKKDIKLKHSKLSITAFVIIISLLIPLCTIIAVHTRIIIPGLNKFQADALSEIFFWWFIVAPILALIFSGMDLKKPDRSKILTKITFFTALSIICIAIIFSIVSISGDVVKIFSRIYG